MGKKAKITRFDDEDKDDIEQGHEEDLPDSRTETTVNQDEEDEGAPSNEGEKRKRKRKRSKPDEKAEIQAESGDAVSKPAKGNTIRGGSGEIVAQSAVPPGATAYTNATIYIEGIPYEATEADVRKFFQGCGTIKSLRLPTWQDTGRLRGYGHVEFDSDAAANKARELDGTYLLKRYIKIDTPKVPKVLINAATTAHSERPVGCKQVFVKNIPYDCSEEDIRESFKICGPIAEIRLARWGHTNQLKGFCYVSFKREDSAEIAVKKSGKLTIRSRPVLIDYETGAPKGGFKKYERPAGERDTSSKPAGAGGGVGFRKST